MSDFASDTNNVIDTGQSEVPSQPVAERETMLNGQGNAAADGFVRDLQRRERDLSDFIENAAVALHWVGEDGTILWANRAELQLLGYAREEYVGRNIAEFHADARVIDDILRRLKNNEELHEVEARLRCKDGTIRYVSINSSVYREDERFVHTRCVTLDLTAQKQAAEIQQRLSAIVESSDDAIISKDMNGIIRSWNQGAERIFGYRPEEIIGRHISTLAVPERVDEIPDILARLAQGERVDHYQTKRQTKDGKVLTISLTVSPIRDAEGTIVGASKVARDITERETHQRALEQANAVLLQANADLQQFAYSASHDLQEPLRMVSTFSELLKREFGSKLGPTGDEYLGYTLQGALRMEQLLRDLRAYTLASTSEPVPAEDVDAGAMFDKSMENLAAAIKDSGASITRSDLPHVRLHEFQMEQLFQNLIGNAIRYRGEAQPQIHVAAHRQGSDWIFSVQDNGIGIDAEYKEQIFGLFKRLHSVAAYPGTGMGLAICKRIVERVGGRIWVESEPGRGSTFFFTLPA
jgi:PAS domain S-box-containing protein